MISSTIILWGALCVGFLVLEGCTVAMVSLWFAFGAAAALLIALLGGAFWLQVPGSQGLVTEAIDNLAYHGQVKLGAMTWTARSTSGEPIGLGTRVVVDRVEGVKVFVSPVKVPSETV